MYRPLLAMVLVCVAVGVAALFLFAAQADWVEWNAASFERVETRVNDHTESTQNRVALDVDIDGVATVVWESRRQQRGRSGLYMRTVGIAGVPVGPEIALNDTLRSRQRDPAVSVDGGVALAWAAGDANGTGDDVWLRTSPTAPPLRVGSGPLAGGPSVTRIGNGRTLVAWAAVLDDGHTSIVTRLIGADGNPAPEPDVRPRPFGDDATPVVGALPDGGFVMAWTRVVSQVGSILCQEFDAAGHAVRAPIVISDPTHTAIEPALAVSPEGSVLIAWMDRDTTRTDYDVFVSLVRGDMATRPQAVRARSARWESGVAVAADPTHGFAIVWNEANDATRDTDVLARRVNESGAPEGEVLRVTSHAAGAQSIATASGARRVAFAPDGRLLVAWSGESRGDDPSAAMLTQLRPKPGGLFERAASALRERLRVWATQKPQPATGTNPAAPHQPPVVRRLTERADRTSIVRRGTGTLGFTGFFDSSWNPPDPNLAIGPSSIMLIGNGTIVARDLNGSLMWENAIDGATGFWGSVGATDLVFDPEIHYDSASGRFMAMACERDEFLSYVLLAVSSTSDPSDAWHKYRIDVTPIAGELIDSPNLAVDADVIYVSADFFLPDRVLLLTIDKTSVLSGGALSYHHIISSGTHSFGLPRTYGTPSPIAYMIESFESEPETSVRLWAIRDPLTAPWLQSVILTVPTYYQPPQVPSLGTSARIQTFNARFWSSALRDSSLWACHHIAQTGDSTRRSVARWYEFRLHGWPTSGNAPELVQAGTVDPGSPVHLSFAAIAPDANGNAVMVYTRSAVDEYLSMSRSVRFASNASGTMPAGPDTVKASHVTFPSTRWGDYAAVEPDPSTPGVFWMAGEYSPSSGFWEVWVEREDVSVTVDTPESTPDVPAAAFAFPMPSSGPTTFRVRNPLAGSIRADVFGIDGRLVRRMDWGPQPAGELRLPWDGRTDSGGLVGTGRYVVRLSTDARVVATVSVTVLR